MLGVVIDLLIVSEEEERTIVLDRPADCEAELVLSEIGREALGTVVRDARQRAVLSIIVQRAVELIGA